MKDISSVESLTIPEGVTVAIKSRIVTVEGPRGKLVKNVGHVQMDIQLVSGFTIGSGSGGAAYGYGLDRLKKRGCNSGKWSTRRSEQDGYENMRDEGIGIRSAYLVLA
jgi:hypothetical protein